MPYKGKMTGIYSLTQSFLLTSKNKGDILDVNTITERMVNFMAKRENSEGKPKRRSRVGLVFLIILLLLVGTAGFLIFTVVKGQVALDDPQAMAAAAPLSAEERFSFSAADRTVQMKVNAADIWNFVLNNAGTDFLDMVNQELSAYSLRVSGCGIQIDERGAQLNLELFYENIRLAAKVPFSLEASGQHFSLKPTGVKVGVIPLPVKDMLSSVQMEGDLQLPVISDVTEIRYEADAIVICGSMKEDIRSLIPQRRTMHRLAVFDESWQFLAAALDTEEGYTALLSYLEQSPGKIEDIYSTLFVFAGYDSMKEYLNNHMDLTQRVLPGVDFSSNEAKRAELIKQEDPLFSILERFFASVVSDYNGNDFSLSDGEFLKKLKPFHPTNYGTGSYNALYEVLNPDDFSLVLVDVENGYTEKTPVFNKLIDENQQFTQPVDYHKTYILGFVFRSAAGMPFLLYETEIQVDGTATRDLMLRVLSEEEVSALRVPGKFGVWTG